MIYNILKISEIKKNPNNPRFIRDNKFKLLVKSIKEFPEMLKLRPIVINEEKVVLGGNMRLTAAIEAGLKEVPTTMAVGLSEEKQREFVIKDNASFGEWEWDLLANEWNSVELQDWGLDTWMNEDDFITSEEFNIPDIQKEPFQNMTFHLADTQAEFIKETLKEINSNKAAREKIDKSDHFGNTNSNGNALYYILKEWAEQKK